MGIGLGPQSLNPSSLATYDLLHSLRCEHWNARFGVAGGLQAKLCIFVHSELCCVLPFGGVGLLDPLHSWVCCLGGPDLHKSGVLAAWGGGGWWGACRAGSVGCSGMPFQLPVLHHHRHQVWGLRLPQMQEAELIKIQLKGTLLFLHTLVFLLPLKHHSYPKPHFFPSFQIPLD